MSQERAKVILGIETSCDETASSVAQVNKKRIELLSNIVSSQIDIHKKYGGVIPEVAAREHVVNIIPVMHEALQQADISFKDIDKIAVTVGPGLITSLNSGVETAKALSFAWDIPVVGVNHIEGHIFADFISAGGFDSIQLPAIVLTVSGGHTMLILMKDFGDYETLGVTRDDAAGEAFDKAAKLMELGYPGGPIVSQKAQEYMESEAERDENISLSRPMLNSGDFDFSFSGLKTSLLYAVKKDPNWRNKIQQYCYEFQQAVIDVLIAKTLKAAQEYKVKSVMLAGGVSANRKLRFDLAKAIKEKLSETEFFAPEMEYATDNAAMIAVAGYFKKVNTVDSWKDLRVDCNLRL
jgi:N6-L-threonylcarbamoyladenine synthase